MLTKKDIIIASVILFSGLLIGFGAGWKSKPEQIIPEDDKFNAIYKRFEKLENKDSILFKHIDSLRISGDKTDAAMSVNLKNIAYELKDIKRFTPHSRSHYIDSILAVDSFK